MKPLIFLFMTLLLFSCNTPTNIIEGGEAKFIFRATVQNVNAATLPEIKDVSKCIVVKVTQVIFSPPGFEEWEGRLITVASEKINSHKPSSDMIFYTNGWLYGKSLAVVEVSSMASREITDKEVLEGIKQQQDSKVRERLKESDIVVTGEIVEVKEKDSSNIRSEHHPYWTTALIKVDTYEKGENEPLLEFKFSSSVDIMWEASPKFNVGDKGIWLFRNPKDNEKEFTIMQQEDFFAIEQLAKIRSLLK